MVSFVGLISSLFTSQVAEAYEVLSDEEKRKKYDQVSDMWVDVYSTWFFIVRELVP